MRRRSASVPRCRRGMVRRSRNSRSGTRTPCIRYPWPVFLAKRDSSTPRGVLSSDRRHLGCSSLRPRHGIVTRRAETASAGSGSAASRARSAARGRGARTLSLAFNLDLLLRLVLKPQAHTELRTHVKLPLIEEIPRFIPSLRLCAIVHKPTLVPAANCFRNSANRPLAAGRGLRRHDKTPAGEARRGECPGQNGMSSASSRSCSIGAFLPRPLAGALGSAGASSWACGALVRKLTSSA